MRRYLLNSLTVVVALVFLLVGCSSETAKQQKNQLTIEWSDKEKPLVISHTNGTLSAILQKNGQNVAELKKKYQPSIPWEQVISTNHQVTLHCKYKVNLVMGGKKVGTYETQKQTVGGFLQDQKVKLTAWDELLIPANKKISDGMVITIDQFEQRVKKVVANVPYKTKEEKDDKLNKGEKKVKTKGKKGKQVFEIVVNYKNGTPISDENKRLVKEIKPSEEVIAIGTKEKPNDDDPPAEGKTLTVQTTAYTHTGNPTATGTMPHRGTIAVDTNVIPMGTRVYIPGYGYGVAQDTGGRIKGRIIDLFMETEQECINWGRRTVTIKILG